MAYHEQRRPTGGLGCAIRHIRRRLDLSQPELAAKFGWDQSLIAKYELGHFRPGAARLIRLLRLAEGAERAAIIRVLQEQGVSESDLSIPGMTPGSGGGAGKAMSEAALFSNTTEGAKP
jgi:DNA-binding transcriptional regulator YiaG